MRAQLRAEFARRFRNATPAARQGIVELAFDQVFMILERGSDWRQLHALPYWFAHGPAHHLDSLCPLLLRGDSVGLTHTLDLHIPSRVALGHTPAEPMGQQISDDLFTVVGRANWLLKRLTGQDPGSLPAGASDQDRRILALKWAGLLPHPAATP